MCHSSVIIFTHVSLMKSACSHSMNHSVTPNPSQSHTHRRRSPSGLVSAQRGPFFTRELGFSLNDSKTVHRLNI